MQFSISWRVPTRRGTGSQRGISASICTKADSEKFNRESTWDEAACGPVQGWPSRPTILSVMEKSTVQTFFEVACPDCGAMLKIDGSTGLVVSHTPAPRKRMFEDLETAAKAMQEREERKESIFRQSVDAERNKADLLEKKFAEALRKAKDAPQEGKPLREFDLD
jgi:hypothetical protein